MLQTKRMNEAIRLADPGHSRQRSPSLCGLCSGGRHRGDCVFRPEGRVASFGSVGWARRTTFGGQCRYRYAGPPGVLMQCRRYRCFRRLPKLPPLCKVRTMSLTPMMQQYQSIRRTLPANTLLLFRLGDFYELFFEDAKLAAELLNVALTKRNGMPMCGVP